MKSDEVLGLSDALRWGDQQRCAKLYAPPSKGAIKITDVCETLIPKKQQSSNGY